MGDLLTRLQDPKFFVALLLVGIVLMVYAPVSHYEFVDLDDDLYVRDKPRIKQGVTWDNLGWALTTFREGVWSPTMWCNNAVNRIFLSRHAACAPLSTLRQPLTSSRRMTRGRGGWLSLPRTALSSAVSCRFIPTLSAPPTFRKQMSGVRDQGSALFTPILVQFSRILAVPRAQQSSPFQKDQPGG
jgi:hypothetical protein